MKQFFLVSCSLGAVLMLVACGGGSSSSNSGEPGGNEHKDNPRRLNWEGIPSEFNPKTSDIQFNFDDIEKIKMDVFGFKDDVEIIYSDSIPKNTGVLRTFTVFKKSASFGGTTLRRNAKDLDLKFYGQYACSIRIESGQITALEGGCYVRLQVFLPKGSEVEVYNVENLISKRFIVMDTETFLKNFDKASWDEDRYAAIDEYLNSYVGMAKKPALLTAQLEILVGDFLHVEDKYKVLGRLHSLVTDREHLASMIEREFSYFEREEARRIVGL